MYTCENTVINTKNIKKIFVIKKTNKTFTI